MRRNTAIVGLMLAVWLSGCGSDLETAPRSPAATDRAPVRTWSEGGEAHWLRGALSQSGYDVTGDTGSALIATGHGSTFYVWANDFHSVRAEEASGTIGRLDDEGYKRVGQVDGLEVLSDGVRLMWESRRRRIWVEEGPQGQDLPALEQLRSLVLATGS